MEISNKPGMLDASRLSATAAAEQVQTARPTDWARAASDARSNAPRPETSLQPVSAPRVALDEALAAGADSFAAQLEATPATGGEGAEDLMAAFLKLQILGDEGSRDYMKNLIEAASILSQLAIANARKMTHTAQQAGSYATMIALMVVYDILDRQMSRMVEDKQVKQQKEVKKRLEGQMNGEEDKDVDPEKREGKFKRRSANATAVMGETSDFAPGTLWSLVHADRQNVSHAIRSLTGAQGDLAATRAALY